MWHLLYVWLHVVRSGLAMLLFIGICSGVATTVQAGTLLIVGDSISTGYGMPTGKGWVGLLEARIVQRGYPHAVVNASVSGDTSAGGLSRLPSLLQRHRPVIVVIELGGNDGLRGMPIKNTRQNLMQMVQMAKKTGAQVLLTGMDIPPNYGPRYAGEFRDLYPAVAKAADVQWVPAFLATVGADPALMQPDGIHPNLLAQPLLVDAVWPVLEPMLKATR